MPQRRDLSDALNALNMLRKLPEDTLHRGAACRADAVQTAIRVAPRWVCAEPQPFDFTSRRSQMQQGGFVICYLDYCDASSSSRSSAGNSTEQKPAFRGARSDTAGTSDLRWLPSCDNPCGSCRSNACCSRLLYSRGSYRLADWQRPSSPQVQQGQRSEEVNSDIGIHGARWMLSAQSEFATSYHAAPTSPQSITMRRDTTDSTTRRFDLRSLRIRICLTGSELPVAKR
jgi:hypothetical protein